MLYHWQFCNKTLSGKYIDCQQNCAGLNQAQLFFLSHWSGKLLVVFSAIP